MEPGPGSFSARRWRLCPAPVRRSAARRGPRRETGCGRLRLLAPQAEAPRLAQATAHAAPPPERSARRRWWDYRWDVCQTRTQLQRIFKLAAATAYRAGPD